MMTMRVLFLTAAVSVFTGCFASSEVAVRPQFGYYRRVAIWTNLSRHQEELFIPLYMKAFPEHTVVDRRDIQTIVGREDTMPDRLDETMRARIRRDLGVEAIVYPTCTETQFAVKVIDMIDGAITASAVVSGKNYITDEQLSDESLMRKLIVSIRGQM